MQNISSAANGVVAYAVISSDDPVAARIVERWASPDDRAQARSRGLASNAALLARAGLRALLARAIGTGGWVFCTDDRGKLFVDARGPSRPVVSLSHTSGAVACAVATDGSIGIDLERHRSRDHAGIAAYAFGARERARIEREGVTGFYRIWTLREAISKATGEGLALVTDTVDRVDGGPFTGVWQARYGKQDWLLYHARPEANLSLAVAVGSEPDRGVPNIVEVTVEELVRQTCSI